MFEQVLELTESNQWTHHGVIAPEISIRSSDSTATRSFNRKEETNDTNSNNDWYICETSSSSFGDRNNTEQYLP